MNTNEGVNYVTFGVATIGFVGTLIGLLVDIPQLQQSIAGQIAVWVIFFLTLSYLLFVGYKTIVRELNKRKKKIDRIREIINRFTSEYSGQNLEDLINHEIINLIIDTKRMRELDLKIVDLQQLSEEKIKIVINKGLIDGPTNLMAFKIFHNSQMEEIGDCECSATHNQSSLIVTKSDTCSIAINSLTKDNIEIRLLDPYDMNKMNYLLADMLFELDFKS